MTALSNAGLVNFPNPGWAWPTGGLHSLLLAVLSNDSDLGLNAARRWFESHDIDNVTFREHRLLCAIAARYGRQLSDRPEYARLTGLQRMLWSKSRMAFREALPALHELIGLNVSVMLLKGASRLALSSEDQKARVSNDLDLLVSPDNAVMAIEVLQRSGWSTSTGESLLALKRRLPGTRAINMFYGHFGDIDLHHWAFQTPRPSRVVENAIWQNGVASDFFGVPVLVPSATDRFALALSSSALDAHNHSDWLVDCKHALSDPSFDFHRFVELVKQLGMAYQATNVLTYFKDKIGLDVPENAELLKMVASMPSRERVSMALRMKPRTDWNIVTRPARGVAKALAKTKLKSELTAPVKVKLAKIGGMSVASNMVTRAQVSIDRRSLTRTCTISLTLALAFKGLRRRYEFEINTETTNVGRFRVRDLFGLRGMRKVQVSVPVNVEDLEDPIFIESRPGRHLPNDAPDKLVARYSAAPFSIQSINFVSPG
ncbi:MAG: nucleotidyltransferase family protein [Pseudomonadota bacterium]